MKNHKDFTMYSLWMTTDCYTQINLYIAANPPPSNYYEITIQ